MFLVYSHCIYILGLIACQAWLGSDNGLRRLICSLARFLTPLLFLALALSLNGFSRRVISPWEVSPALLSFKATPTLLQTPFPPVLLCIPSTHVHVEIIYKSF